VKNFVVCLMFALPATPSFALPHDCESVPAIVVDDYVIEGQAIKNGQILSATNVSLYSYRKLVRQIDTDNQAQFIFDHLSPGAYQLSIHGLGSFNVKVVPLAGKTLPQREHYTFSRMNGCLNWVSSTN
jgi:hypothetical protein